MLILCFCVIWWLVHNKCVLVLNFQFKQNLINNRRLFNGFELIMSDIYQNLLGLVKCEQDVRKKQLETLQNSLSSSSLSFEDLGIDLLPVLQECALCRDYTSYNLIINIANQHSKDFKLFNLLNQIIDYKKYDIPSSIGYIDDENSYDYKRIPSQKQFKLLSHCLLMK